MPEFALAAHRKNAMHAAGDEMVRQLAQRALVDRVVGRQGCDIAG